MDVEIYVIGIIIGLFLTGMYYAHEKEDNSFDENDLILLFCCPIILILSIGFLPFLLGKLVYEFIKNSIWDQNWK